MSRDPALGLAPFERRLMDIIERRGLRAFVVAVAGSSVALSELITMSWLVAIDTPRTELLIGAATAVMVPAIVAPLTAWTIGRLLHALAQASVELQHLANTDGLTGVANRRAFAEAASTLWAQRNGMFAVVTMVDIDDFKRVNDRFGHSAGDLVLSNLANGLTDAVDAASDSAVVGRLGGDEFAVVALVGDARSASALADRVRRACDLGGVRSGVTASPGVLVIAPDEGCGWTVDEALSRADHALYSVKSPASREAPAASEQGEPVV